MSDLVRIFQQVIIYRQEEIVDHVVALNAREGQQLIGSHVGNIARQQADKAILPVVPMTSGFHLYFTLRRGEAFIVSYGQVGAFFRRNEIQEAQPVFGVDVLHAVHIEPVVFRTRA